MNEQELVEEQVVDAEQPAEPENNQVPEASAETEAATAEPVEEEITAEAATGDAEASASTSPVEAEESADTAEAEDSTVPVEAEDSTDAAEAEDSGDEADEAEDSGDEADDTSDTDSIFDLQPRQQVVGTVKNITKFGAFVDMGLPQDGLVHISELARRKVNKVEDVVSVGQEVEVWVKKVDRKRGRISLTMVKPVGRRIRDIKEGEVLEGTVTRLESYGAFVDVDSERDGLVHISQITHDYIKHPGDVLSVGDKIQVKVLKVNRKKRQIDLSMKALLPPPAAKQGTSGRAPKAVEQAIEEVAESDEPKATAMAVAFATLHQETSEENASSEEQPDFDSEKQKRKQEQEEIIARMLAANE